MKIAYIIIAHNNYQHLARLVRALDDSNCAFYIHIDRKSDLPRLQGPNIVLIEQRVNVHWSGFSLVRATLNLLERAMKDENDYFALISGADYPIKSTDWLREKLELGGEFITVREGFDRYNPLSRYRYYYFTDYYDRRDKSKIKTKLFLSFQKLLRRLRVIKRVPFQLYTGSQWFILSRSCVTYVLDTITNDKRYIRFFKTAFCSDECFFQTIIGNSDFLQQAKPNLTYADWTVNPGPAIISGQHIPILEGINDKFFARKFTDHSVDVLEEIEKMRAADFTGQKIKVT